MPAGRRQRKKRFLRLLLLSFFLFLLAGSAAHYIYILKRVTRTALKHTTRPKFDRSTARTAGLIEAIGAHSKFVSWGESGSMRFVVLAMTDRSNADMALNLYFSSFMRFNISNFLFVGGGKNACERLNRLRIQCLDFWEDPDSDVSSNFGSKEFIRKMNIRTEMILAALRANFSVLHTDSDVVFLKNPMAEIEALLETNDMAILWDHSLFNAGFLAVKATSFSVGVYEQVQSITNVSLTPDQEALNAVLLKTNSDSVATLPKGRYLPGVDYFVDGRVFPPADWSDSCPSCTVVHNNWIIGKEPKIYRFKEAALWYVDEDGYYSDTERRYLLVRNPTLRYPPKTYDERLSEIEALGTALKVAAMLNRTLIVPRFHCLGGEECPLGSLLDMETFDRHFAPDYRESSFLLNDLVPRSISARPRKNCTPSIGDVPTPGVERLSSLELCSRRDDLPELACVPFNPVPILIVTAANQDLLANLVLDSPNSQVLDLSGHEFLSEKLVRDTFGECPDQVLVLSSLIAVRAVFSDPRAERSFDLRFRNVSADWK